MTWTSLWNINRVDIFVISDRFHFPTLVYLFSLTFPFHWHVGSSSLITSYSVWLPDTSLLAMRCYCMEWKIRVFEILFLVSKEALGKETSISCKISQRGSRTCSFWSIFKKAIRFCCFPISIALNRTQMSYPNKKEKVDRPKDSIRHPPDTADN